MSPVPTEEFLSRLQASLDDGAFVRLTLGKPRGGDASLQKLLIRPVELQGGPHLSFLWRHETRDVTKNLSATAALGEIRGLLGAQFFSAHLFTPSHVLQLEFNKKGEPRLTTGKADVPAPDPRHDQAKERLLPAASQAWLHALGVTTTAGAVREGMADKHRQIHKFVEILSHLAAAAPLALSSSNGFPADRPLEIADMGCGKGYLTFATHDYFNLVAGRAAHVRGIEARPELAALCGKIARDTGRTSLAFEAGTIQQAELDNIDVLVALHACDTATDDALARGIAAGAALIVVAPCCQKELRPQLTAPFVLAPALRHGIWRERHAEFATDALRALLLDWAGYDTKVFEFISTEHTAKNTMITATKRTAADTPALREKHAHAIRDLAAFYGIKSQALARQLGFTLTS